MAEPSLSRVTVALMIQSFDTMYRRLTRMIPGMFDIDQLAMTLFAMGFDQDFISRCRYQYGWDFKTLFPALDDGSFYGSRPDGHARAKGQLHLVGFATFLCGAFRQYPALRTPLNDHFERSLLNDGYRFDGTNLVPVNMDTSVPQELAKLPNRESLLCDLSSQMRDAYAAVLFIDLDHFNDVNDKLSHAHGDECLASVVRIISDVLRHRGRLYRVGGDEFCAMLPNCFTEEAAATAERIRKSIDALKPFFGMVKVTTSIGVAASDRKELSAADTLVKAADEAMYVAKHTAKNRVRTWPPDKTEAAEAEANRHKRVNKR